MAEIIEFPTFQTRTWVEVEKGVKNIVGSAGYDADVVPIVLNNIRPLFEILTTGVEIASAKDEAVDLVNSDQINDFGSKIFLERVNREIFIAQQLLST